MQIKLLGDITQRENILIFFSGFGCDDSFFRHLSLDSLGVVFIYDYRNLDSSLANLMDLRASLMGKSVNLMAWSMGVGMADYFYPFWETFKPRIRIAINGTKEAIHLHKGIPPKIFKFTIKNLDPLSFYQNTLDSTQASSLQNANFRDAHTLKEELNSLYTTLYAPRTLQSGIWDYALISQEDKIFPAQAQELSWKDSAHSVIKLHSPHFIFGAFSSWQDLIHLENLRN